ncbi:MAG TPA: hypothetical protein DDW62_02945 [Marinilabiliaceae bacterium]|mgnify:FL=1|nr:hypothetical protein [Marinilabiliaceae bacterium]
MHTRRLLIISALIWLGSCSTQKNTWLSRNHNTLTAKYNILFNGEQSFMRGENQLKQTHVDNFTAILPLFPYSGEDKAGAVKGEMDRAIEKGLKLIQKKSITVRPKGRPDRDNPRQMAFYNQREYNRVVDDAYILIGKAHLYNHEFFDALTALEYAFREFPGKAAQFEALIWMAKTRVEMGDYENALILLERYDGLGKAPAKLYPEYMATYADYLIRTGQYNSAIPFMIAAASGSNNKWDKSRRNFILAQLYENAAQLENANVSYERVIRSSPGYQMEFTARVNMLLIGSRLNTNYDETRRELIKFAAQFKNQEYRDLIYMAVAKSYLQEGDSLQALTNLKLAAGYNMGNRELLAETYIEMASIYFEQPDYPASYAYYDSTLTLMPQNDSRYDRVKFRHKGLADLSEHFTTIQREDSLQRLAALPEAELDAFLDAMIEAERQAQLNRQIAGATPGRMANYDPMFNTGFSNLPGRTADTQGGWYFYNPATVSLGKMEFERRWGRRASEDNWRRSNKSLQTAEDSPQPPPMPGEPGEKLFEAIDMPEEKAGKRSLTELPSKEELMAAIPKSEEQLSASHKLKGEAYFDAAMVFLDYFKQPEKARLLFSALLEEYPDHELAEQAIFWSYRAYKEEDDKAGSETMKALLLNRFPEGYYAPFVSDPEHAANLIKAKKELQQKYEDAYSAYKSNRFNEALRQTDIIITQSDNVELGRNALLLSAVSYGKLGNKTGFVAQLQTLSNEHSNSPEGKMAIQWLGMLDEGLLPAIGPVNIADRALAGENTESAGYKSPDEQGSLYLFEPNEVHSIFLVVNSEADINRLIFKLADYNFKRFLLADYELESHSAPDGKRIVTIGPFKNRREVMDYFYALRSNTNLLQVDNLVQPMLMAGSKANLNALTRTGDFDAYRTFFSQYYLAGAGGIIIDLTYENLEEQNKQTVAPEASGFKASDGIHLAMVVVPANIQTGRISGFLSSHALNLYNLKVSNKTVKLNDGRSVIVVERFDSKEDASDFISSLSDIPYWNNQLKGDSWYKAAVSPDNFKLIEEMQSIEKFVEFETSTAP